MRTPAESIVVLGLGNLLCADDGVGVAAVVRLERDFEPPPEVVFVDGGTLGMALLDYFERDRTVILVDAIRAAGPPGAIVRLDGAEVADAVAGRLSPHQVGVSDLLAAARWLDRYPRRVILIGAIPESVEPMTPRTPALDAALPGLVAAVVEELATLGFPLRRREKPRAPENPVDLRVARAFRV